MTFEELRSIWADLDDRNDPKAHAIVALFGKLKQTYPKLSSNDCADFIARKLGLGPHVRVMDDGAQEYEDIIAAQDLMANEI